MLSTEGVASQTEKCPQPGAASTVRYQVWEYQPSELPVAHSSNGVSFLENAIVNDFMYQVQWILRMAPIGNWLTSVGSSTDSRYCGLLNQYGSLSSWISTMLSRRSESFILSWIYICCYQSQGSNFLGQWNGSCYKTSLSYHRSVLSFSKDCKIGSPTGQHAC